MQILSSLSGLQFSAASAGYAPTNSADVSAIASAYATGIGSSEASAIASAYAESAASGKLDSTAFSTVSGDFLTAHQSLAGYATEAYVDSSVSGKLDSTAFNSADFYSTSNPSSFVDSAYVDSAVSGKQDELTFAYDADSAISSINGSALAGGGGATGDYVEKSSMAVTIGSGNTASNTAFTQGLRNSASNGSFAQGSYCKATGASFAQGYSAVADGGSLAQGYYVSAKNYATALGTYNLKGDGDISTGESAAFVIGDGYDSDARHDLMVVTKDGEITMFSSTDDTAGTGIMSSIRAISAAAGGVDSATVSAIASSYAESAVSGKLDSSAYNSADFYTTANESGFVDSAYVDSAVSGKQDAITFAYDADSAISSINGSALAGGGGGGGADYSAGNFISIADNVISTTGLVPLNGSAGSLTLTSYKTAGLFNGNNILSAVNGWRGWSIGAIHYGYPEYNFGISNYWAYGGNTASTASHWVISNDAVSATWGTAVKWRLGSAEYNYWNAKLDSSSIECDANSAITAIGGSSIGGGGGGGVDSATVSAIASSYAESAASSKLDTTAFNSGDFYSTANPSGFITGVDLSPYQTTADMSGYIPTSMSSDFQPVTGMSSYALSADVSGTVDLVTGSSSTWNGVTAKMDSTAFQSAYASASASQATAQGVLYILIPDGV